ncbi:hypothetical protein [Streptomyces caniferus]|uniref:Uncharacterized protein n=1 Tax=Streptomyces sp. R08 TaxID=3238624 RepID=A0AB39M2W8_9ACTN|nr:hypothetical protein [Streptomyces caniferus]
MNAEQAEMVTSYPDGTIGVTIKYGKGYEDTWAVFRGSVDRLRAMITEYFGFRPEMVADLSLSELVVEATNIAHGNGNLAAYLGATRIGVPQPEQPQADDPWSQAEAAPPAPKDSGSTWALAEIKKQASIADLQKFWAGNQSFFADPEVMTAYKARGRELQAA